MLVTGNFSILLHVRPFLTSAMVAPSLKLADFSRVEIVLLSKPRIKLGMLTRMVGVFGL